MCRSASEFPFGYRIMNGIGEHGYYTCRSYMIGMVSCSSDKTTVCTSNALAGKLKVEN